MPMDTSYSYQRNKSPEATELQSDLESVVVDPKVLVSQRKKKNMNGKPTRPLSAYNLFYRYERTRWVEGLKINLDSQKIPPKERFLAMGRHVAKRWHELPETEKRKYKEEAAPYYAEFLEEKKRYTVQRSKEGAEEGRSLEEAAQKEATARKDSGSAAASATDPETMRQLDDQHGYYNHCTPPDVFHPLLDGQRVEYLGIYASMKLGHQQQQAAEAQNALLSLRSRSNFDPCLINAASRCTDLAHFLHRQKQLPDHTSTTVFLQILLREQQRMLESRLPVESQQQQLGFTSAGVEHGTLSPEQMRLMLTLPQATTRDHNHDVSVLVFLDMLRRSNFPAF